jgi:hypothetical protein
MSALWRQLLEEAKALPKLHPAQLYDVAKLLVQVAEDREFLAFLEGKRLNGLDVLNHPLQGTGADYGELAVMLKAFPDRKQWAEADLRELKMRASILPRVKV